MEEIDLSKELQEFYGIIDNHKKEMIDVLGLLSIKYSNLHFSNETLILSIRGSKSNCVKIRFKTNVFSIISDWGGKSSRDYPLSQFDELKWVKRSLFSQSFMRKGDYLLDGSTIGSFGGDFINKVQPIITEIKQNIIPKLNVILEEEEKLKNEKERLKEQKRLKELQVSKTNVLSELDKDGNGEVDVVEGNDFNTLLKKHQKSIIEVDRNYVQQFVKVSSYLKTKKGNIQSIFNSIKDIPNQEELNEYVEILKDEIHIYDLVLLNSLRMIVFLVEDDMITFYEIHEMFDTLNMFDSKHEKDVSQKLTNIGDGLKDLMYEIRDMGNKISNSIQELTSVNEETNILLKEQLSGINSTLKVGNFINTINTYQNYKTNRRLNS
ncbi:hypothetical protein N8351_05255 [Flavobacteriaceae bacterium]|nr:hypothetical protein [Flavobacteriaceae bacterium]